jgi:L-fuconolactonase
MLDTHHHIWDPAVHDHSWLVDHPRLRRRFDLTDFERSAEPAGVTESVLVQTLNDIFEGRWILESARADPMVKGVVAWVDLESAHVAEQLAELAECPGGGKLVGIRHLVHDELEADYLSRSLVARGLRAVARAGLTFDLLLRPRELPAAIQCVRATDDLHFVVDHIAKPNIAAGITEPWRELIGQLAALPNVSCKLSGLVTEAGKQWRDAPIARYVHDVIDLFGADRLMFGSDWPVCVEVATYSEVVGLMEEIVVALGLSRGEREAIFYKTGESFYGIGDEK